MRILFISPYIPSRVRVRPYNFIKTLVERGHRVTLASLQPPGDEGEDVAILQEWCEAVHIMPHRKLQTLVNAALALPSRFPIQAAYSRSGTFNRLIRELTQRESYDAVHVEHLRGAVLVDAVRNIPIVFDSVDSISLLFGKVLQDAPSPKSRMMAMLDLGRTRRFEGRLTQRFTQVAVTSAADRQALIDLGSQAERITVVPNGVDLEYFCPQAVERYPLRLVFSGKMSYHANIAAVEDLVTQVMPLVWAKQPKAELYIVGKDPAASVEMLAADPRIIVTGTVPDLRPYLASATVAVSTVRYGVGIQNKVLEAMAMATPVVCSTQASSALSTQSRHDILVGDNPQAIADHILTLLADADYRAFIGANGRTYVEAHQSWHAAAAHLETLYSRAQQASSTANSQHHGRFL
jgi:sugar transferase (PEP-CTERM/EpsH1 system associated)